MRDDDCVFTRRAFLGTGAGALVVSFAIGGAQAQDAAPDLPGDLPEAPALDAWIRIDAEGEITVFTGKAELGQGAKTALSMVAAEELLVGPADVTIVTADTGRTPDEGYTAGSQTMANSGTAIRYAAANVRALLIAEAARQAGAEPGQVLLEGKQARIGDRSFGYGDLARALDLSVAAKADVALIDPGALRVLGTEVARRDIPAKLTGGAAYVHDFRPPGMLHARVVRPPSPGATLASLDDTAVREMPGVVTVLRNGDFLAVVAEREYQALLAMRAMQDAAAWTESETLPPQDTLYQALRGMETEVGTVNAAGEPAVPDGPRTLRASFTRPYTMHGSIGPSCAVAQMQDGQMTVWSHTQGVFPDRSAIAQLLGMPEETVRVIHMEGAGCYGHNGADDAAADAALIARETDGRPVRVQWTREQEHGWEPYGPAMSGDLAAALDKTGMITHFTYDLWSNAHSSRPGGAGNLLAGGLIQNGFSPDEPALRITPSGNGDRNADPYYRIPNRNIQWHFIKEPPLRVSALRGLGAYANVFAIECFMDELAILAGTDPVAFRLKHLEDQRAIDVVQAVVDQGGWSGEPLPPGSGRGFAFGRYKNHAAYMALSLTAEVERETGRIRVRDVVAAIDSGEIVSRDGIVNQTEGGICQSLSWTLYEEVIFDRTRITSIDWSSYPMLRFASVPDTIKVHVVDRPGEEFLGTGEAAQGPTAAAIGNAIRNAVGVRLWDLPLTRDKLKAAIQIAPARDA